MTFSIEDWERKLRTAQETISEKMFELATTPNAMLIICLTALKTSYCEKSIGKLIEKCFEAKDYKEIRSILDHLAGLNSFINEQLLNRSIKIGNPIENLIFIYENTNNYILQERIYGLIKDNMKKGDISEKNHFKIQRIFLDYNEENQSAQEDDLDKDEQEEIKGLNRSIILLKNELKHLEETIKEKIVDLSMLEKLLEEKEQEIIKINKVLIENNQEVFTEPLIQETPSIQDIQIIRISIQNMEIMLEELTHPSDKETYKIEKLPVYGPKRRRGRPSRK
ncbi:MAG: hypothetical protein PHW52_04895 [Candidatus Pacebacteria bacterium]|nr:hypothetical protein [Candidatus Paceibacterota bacterium]